MGEGNEKSEDSSELELIYEINKLYLRYTQSNYGKYGGWKSSEGAVTISYPSFFEYPQDGNFKRLPKRVDIYSYAFGSRRSTQFKSVEDAIRWVKNKQEELERDIRRFEEEGDAGFGHLEEER